MKKMNFLTAGLIAAMMIPAAAQAQTGELRRDRQDIRQDQRDLRNAQRYGAVVGLSGGLIGPEGTPRDYAGSLERTPVFLGCSDVDGHIPLWRVHESTKVMAGLGASVTERIYPGMGHTINDDEMKHVEALLVSLQRA